jgi:ABC-type Fe3+-hydroxamate transport system substrate-binding protein
MNFTKFAVKLSKYEKGKRQVDIAQIKELIRVMADVFYHYPEAYAFFAKYMMRRAKINAKKDGVRVND